MSRIPPLNPDSMDAEQYKICQTILRTRGGEWFHGPYDALLLQPRLAEPAQQLGEFVRLHTSLPPRVTELVILIVAHHWQCNVEWCQHAPIAAKMGLEASTIEAVLRDITPSALLEDEAIVYAFTRSLLRDKRVAEADYAEAQRNFGTVGVVELTGLIGYYTFLAFVLNVHEIDLAPGMTAPFGSK